MDVEGIGLICCAIVPLGCMCIGFVIAASAIDDDGDEHGSRAGQDATDESSTTTLI